MLVIKNTLLPLCILSLITLLGACGGGGGGSSSGSINNGGNPLTASVTRSADTGVRLLNGAIDASPVELHSSASTSTLSVSRFAMPASYAGVPNSPQIISVNAVGSDVSLFSTEITPGKGEHLTILTYGNNTSLNIKHALIADARAEKVSGGMTAVRVIHSLVGANQINVQSGGTSVASAVKFGSASAYTELPAGETNFIFKRISDSKVVLATVLNLPAGTYQTLLLTGEVDYFVKVPMYED